MGLVLGLSMSSRDIRGVLVDGDTGEGVPVERSVLDFADDDSFDAQAFLAPLLADQELCTVGLTWSRDAGAAAIKVCEALEVVGAGAPVVAVADVEAAEALARGMVAITDYDFLVACIVEHDAAVIATVDGFHAEVECVDGADSATLPDRVLAVVRSARPSPDAVFVLGSGDIDELVAALTEATSQPVITATEAEFALPRGAALAAAQSDDVPDEPVEQRRFSRVGVLSATLAAAVVVFVASVATAVGLNLTADPVAAPIHRRVVVPPSPEAPASAKPAPPSRPTDATALRMIRQPFTVAAPPAAHAPPAYVPPAPAAQPPPAYVPPAPAAQPPPAYVPPPVPPVPPPKPRLRDRILDKIPFLNRFN